MVSQTAEYGLRAVVHLARLGGGPASAQEIAGATKVPLGYLQKVMRMLVRGHILSAQRGVGGGFTLAKVPSAISVLDVLKATDSGVSRIERCPLGIAGHTQLCALHALLDRQAAAAEQVFAGTTIAQMVEAGAAGEPLCQTGPAPQPVRIATNGASGKAGEVPLSD